MTNVAPANGLACPTDLEAGSVEVLEGIGHDRRVADRDGLEWQLAVGAHVTVHRHGSTLVTEGKRGLQPMAAEHLIEIQLPELGVLELPSVAGPARKCRPFKTFKTVHLSE